MSTMTDFLNALRFEDEIDMDTAGDLMSDAADVIEQQMAKIERLKRERDAAISDLKSICDDTGDGCDLCKHLPCVKDGVGHCIGWQWRGLEEGAEDG